MTTIAATPASMSAIIASQQERREWMAELIIAAIFLRPDIDLAEELVRGA
jgi:hypothetical protein